jgi:N-acetylglucosamine-6-phosphate deacetylase
MRTRSPRASLAPSDPISFFGNIVLPDRILTGGLVVCRRGRIVEVARRQPEPKDGPVVESGRGYIAPGYIDIHVHGGAGADFMDGTVDAIRTAVHAHLQRGTTTLFPTTTTGSPAEIQAMIEACRASGLDIPGIHLYGPYFAENKVGCHPRAGRRHPHAREYASYFASGFVRIATCAAELPGAIKFYRAAHQAKCLITCGHSDASWPEMQEAFNAGMRHVDHFWCAMSSVPGVRARLGTPMRGSMAEFVLANDEMSTEVIADGQHLAPELLRFAFQMKGPKKLLLVTDANRALGMPPGNYIFGHHRTGSKFVSDGKVGYVPKQGLASSVISLADAVRIMHRDSGASIAEAIRMASLTPAERTGLARSRGSLAVGKRADVLVLNPKLAVRQVFLAGLRVAK